jgi:hypothetical protein
MCSVCGWHGERNGAGVFWFAALENGVASWPRVNKKKGIAVAYSLSVDSSHFLDYQACASDSDAPKLLMITWVTWVSLPFFTIGKGCLLKSLRQAEERKVRGQHRHVHQARAGATHTNAPVLSARILLDEMCTVCDVCSSNSSSTLNLDVWRPLSANTTST